MILFFDTETTGKIEKNLSPEHKVQPDLVQLAVLMDSGNSYPVAAINLIVEPNGWSIPEGAARIHRISEGHAKLVGVPRRIVLSIFNMLCKKADTLVAHNLEFDFFVMETAYHREGVPHRLDHLKKICTMKAATPVVQIPKSWKSPNDPWKWPTLTETHAFLFNGETFEEAHNAMVDTVALRRVYYELKKRKAL